MPEAEDFTAWMWALWADVGHSLTCTGWTFDLRDRTLRCDCGQKLFVLEAVPADAQ